MRVARDDKVRQGKPRACEYLRMMLLARQPEALQDLTEALGVYDNREVLDKEHMYKRFNPQVLSCHILERTSLNLFAILGYQPCLDLDCYAIQRPNMAS